MPIFSQFEFWAHRDEDPAQFMKSEEAYLFPDGYDFFVGDDVYNMVARIYQEFNTKYLENDLQGKAEAMGFTLTQYVTLASLVQEEAGGAEHQADVAAIFMNRMAEGSPEAAGKYTSSYIQNDNDNNYLNNTVAKVLGGWENIPQEVIDGYDTYSREGLPVGPISNPGLDALWNTTRYAESQYYGNGYYFFVTDINGNYYFNQTAEAHEAQVDELKANGLFPG